jgi:hypothetical protein
MQMRRVLLGKFSHRSTQAMRDVDMKNTRDFSFYHFSNGAEEKKIIEKMTLTCVIYTDSVDFLLSQRWTCSFASFISVSRSAKLNFSYRTYEKNKNSVNLEINWNTQKKTEENLESKLLKWLKIAQIFKRRTKNYLCPVNLKSIKNLFDNNKKLY